LIVGLRAVKAHEKWYRDHGLKDNQIEVMNMVSMDQTTKMPMVTKTEVFFIHRSAPSTEKTKSMHDAGWDNYVKLYRDSSDIKSEYYVCMSKKK